MIRKMKNRQRPKTRKEMSFRELYTSQKTLLLPVQEKAPGQE